MVSSNQFTSFLHWLSSRCGQLSVCYTVVYINYCKAFNTVSWCQLFHRLSCFGICDNLLRWIDEFLDNWTQCVHIDDVVKLLGPGVSCKLYVDDLKLYSVIQTLKDISELHSTLMYLQHGLTSGNSLYPVLNLHYSICLRQSNVEQCYKIKQVNVSFFCNARFRFYNC